MRICFTDHSVTVPNNADIEQLVKAGICREDAEAIVKLAERHRENNKQEGE